MKKSNGARILLIEDDTAMAESLKRLLTEHYRVETAATAEEGLARTECRDFDVVVTDLQMPGISGLDVIKALHPAKPHLPIVLMTGHHTTDTAIEATKSGAYDYVLKPILDLDVAVLEPRPAIDERGVGILPQLRRLTAPVEDEERGEVEGSLEVEIELIAKRSAEAVGRSAVRLAEPGDLGEERA